jgi:hypothetical protein
LTYTCKGKEAKAYTGFGNLLIELLDGIDFGGSGRTNDVSLLRDCCSRQRLRESTILENEVENRGQ